MIAIGCLRFLSESDQTGHFWTTDNDLKQDTDITDMPTTSCPDFYQTKGRLEGLLKSLGGIALNGKIWIQIGNGGTIISGSLKLAYEKDAGSVHSLTAEIEQAALDIAVKFAGTFTVSMQFKQEVALTRADGTPIRVQ